MGAGAPQPPHMGRAPHRRGGAFQTSGAGLHCFRRVLCAPIVSFCTPGCVCAAQPNMAVSDNRLSVKRVRGILGLGQAPRNAGTSAACAFSAAGPTSCRGTQSGRQRVCCPQVRPPSWRPSRNPKRSHLWGGARWVPDRSPVAAHPALAPAACAAVHTGGCVNGQPGPAADWRCAPLSSPVTLLQVYEAPQRKWGRPSKSKRVAASPSSGSGGTASSSASSGDSFGGLAPPTELLLTARASSGEGHSARLIFSRSCPHYDRWDSSKLSQDAAPISQTGAAVAAEVPAASEDGSQGQGQGQGQACTEQPAVDQQASSTRTAAPPPPAASWPALGAALQSSDPPSCWEGLRQRSTPSAAAAAALPGWEQLAGEGEPQEGQEEWQALQRRIGEERRMRQALGQAAAAATASRQLDSSTAGSLESERHQQDVQQLRDELVGSAGMAQRSPSQQEECLAAASAQLADARRLVAQQAQQLEREALALTDLHRRLPVAKREGLPPALLAAVQGRPASFPCCL